MKYIINVALDNLEDKVNRQLLVDEDISLCDFCEFDIVAMNGRKIPLYRLEIDDILYFPEEEVEEENDEKSLIGVKVKDLDLRKDDAFRITYDFDGFYYFNLYVDDCLEDDRDIDFQVLSGNSDGIIDGSMACDIRSIFYCRNYDYLRKSEKEYLQKKFDVIEVNKRVEDYKIKREENRKPKRYIFNVSLEGFNKEIKRKIAVNSNILIEYFCRLVVVSMNGDLSHGYGMKKGSEFVSEWYEGLELFYLGLEEKQRLKIVYDFGDNWVFNLTLSKIEDGYMDVPCKVLAGNGYGIIDDCGGPWGLEDIFSGKDKSWGKYNINDFDLEKCNKKVMGVMK